MVETPPVYLNTINFDPSLQLKSGLLQQAKHLLHESNVLPSVFIGASVQFLRSGTTPALHSRQALERIFDDALSLSSPSNSPLMTSSSPKQQPTSDFSLDSPKMQPDTSPVLGSTSPIFGTSTPLPYIIHICSIKFPFEEDNIDIELANIVKSRQQILSNEGTLDPTVLENVKVLFYQARTEEEFLNVLRQEIMHKRRVKVECAYLQELPRRHKLAERVWLEDDIVPFIVMNPNFDPGLTFESLQWEELNINSPSFAVKSARRRAFEYAIRMGKLFLREDYFVNVMRVSFNPQTRQIAPSYLASLQAYADVFGDRDPSIGIALKLASQVKKLNARVCFLNSTIQGGGVALMRHALLRVMTLLGVNVDWFVLHPEPKVFSITKKKFHNVLQGVAPESVVLNESDVQIYNEWTVDNANRLLPVLRNYNVVVIDDYQPSGLIRYIKEQSPETKIIYRSHIHIRSDLIESALITSQNITWDFIWNYNQVKLADIFVSHPIKEFIPTVVPPEKVTLMPASTDPLDGLNKPLSKQQQDYYLDTLNLMLVMDYQTPLDKDRPFITQVARFDPSKGIQDVLQSYRRFRKKLTHYNNDVLIPQGLPPKPLPQLVIIGHSAIDDPEGIPIHEELKRTLTMDMFESFASDIKLARVAHNDQVLNAVMTRAFCSLQLSHREGLEVKVSEALYHGKPVLLYRAGGMPLQVKDKVNSFVIPVGKTHEVADKLLELYTNDELYESMCRAALEQCDPQFFTMANVMNWLYLIRELLQKGKFEGNVTTLLRERILKEFGAC